MRRIIAIVLTCALSLTACGQAIGNSVHSSEASTESIATETIAIEGGTEESESAREKASEADTEQIQVGELPSSEYKEINTEYLTMDDPDLLQ